MGATAALGNEVRKKSKKSKNKKHHALMSTLPNFSMMNSADEFDSITPGEQSYHF